MKIAIAQMNATMGAFDDTVERVLAHDRAFARQGADLAVYPACVLTGYDPQTLLNAEGFQADVAAALDSLADGCSVPSLVPFVFEFAGAPVPEVAYIHEGRIVPLRMASYLANVNARGSMPVEEPAVQFQLGDTDFGVAFDFAGLDAYSQGAENADVIVYLPFEGYNTDDEATSMASSVGDGFYLQDATRANSWLVAVNSVGAQDEMAYAGGSFILAPWGELACVLPAFEEATAVTEVEPLAEGPLEDPVAPPSYHRMRSLWSALTVTLRDFVDKQGWDGVWLPMTGDLLSCALAALSVDALGPTRVHGLIVPVMGGDAVADARRLASNLRIDCEEVPAETLSAVGELLGDASPSLWCRFARAVAPRIFPDERLLPLTSVDKTALAVGQDPDDYHGALFAPFSDVYRTDLAALVSDRNLKSPVVPRTVQARLEVPAGIVAQPRLRSRARALSDIDSLLLRVIERGESLTDLVRAGTPPDEARAVLSRIIASELERRTCPVGPVLSDRSLVEHRTPLSCHWDDRVRTDEELDGIFSDDGEPTDDVAELIGRFQAIAGVEASVPDPAEAAMPTDIRGYLRDFALGGGLSTDGDDIWGSGLFSKN